MAMFDYGVGCPCGLYRECPPSCQHYNPPRSPDMTRPAQKPAHQLQQAPNAALREIAGRIKKLPYRDLMVLVDALHKGFPGAISAGRDGVVEAVLAAADKLENA